VWSAPLEPGSVHDIPAARAHCLGALYAAAGRGLPTLADKGYARTGLVAWTSTTSRARPLASHNLARLTHYQNYHGMKALAILG